MTCLWLSVIFFFQLRMHHNMVRLRKHFVYLPVPISQCSLQHFGVTMGSLRQSANQLKCSLCLFNTALSVRLALKTLMLHCLFNVFFLSCLHFDRKSLYPVLPLFCHSILWCNYLVLLRHSFFLMNKIGRICQFNYFLGLNKVSSSYVVALVKYK